MEKWDSLQRSRAAKTHRDRATRNFMSAESREDREVRTVCDKELLYSENDRIMGKIMCQHPFRDSFNGFRVSF